MYDNDKRIVATMDAGGTFFRFGAIQGNKPMMEEITFPSESRNLEKCLNTIVNGFGAVMSRLPEKPVAISFAFPGPADYPNGIFPTLLTNFPCFAEGVALGPFLESKFNLSVFINNDADLFTYGEALAGLLPHVNSVLKERGSAKVYRNMVGFILGTGFGIGITTNNQMYIGDNCCSEIYCTPNKLEPELIVEEGVSARAVLHNYRLFANDPTAADYTDSYDIYQIADGTKPGDQAAALKAFARFGEVAGNTIANAVCMLDGIIVLGGGVSKSHKFYMPALLRELRTKLTTRTGIAIPRVPSYVYNLEDEAELDRFIQGEQREIPVFGTDRTVKCDVQKRLAIGISRLGTTQATTIGAYCFALHKLDEK
ncbi:MAG: ROK family protein [Bacteroidales bacterium]|nr:ROK family protein [Bacteroidales bacterium]